MGTVAEACGLELRRWDWSLGVGAQAWGWSSDVGTGA